MSCDWHGVKREGQLYRVGQTRSCDGQNRVGGRAAAAAPPGCPWNAAAWNACAPPPAAGSTPMSPGSTPQTADSNWQPARVSGQRNTCEAKHLGSPRVGQRMATEGQLKLIVWQRMTTDGHPERVTQPPNCDWQATSRE